MPVMVKKSSIPLFKNCRTQLKLTIKHIAANLNVFKLKEEIMIQEIGLAQYNPQIKNLSFSASS